MTRHHPLNVHGRYPYLPHTWGPLSLPLNEKGQSRLCAGSWHGIGNEELRGGVGGALPRVVVCSFSTYTPTKQGDAK